MKRLHCLDGLRGLLASYVLLGHMAPFAALPPAIATALSHGGAAVDVFFILSGLVIQRSLEGHRFRARPFLAARAARIYPLYLAMFALAVPVQAVPIDYARLPWIGPDSPAHSIWSGGWPASWAAEIGAHLLMLHGLLPDGMLPGAWVSFLGSAWSLSTEWQFYVLALLLAGRLGPRRLAWALLLLGVLGTAWAWTAGPGWSFSRAFLPNKAHLFALGVASAVLAAERPVPWRCVAPVFAAVAALCLVQGGPAKLAAPLAWMACMGAQLFPGAPMLAVLHRLLRRPVLLRLGALSYAIYLANEPVQKLLGVGLARMAGGDALLFAALWVPLAILLPVAAALWLHLRIERPALARHRGGS
jgi:peptidoglycan/LPS O-acetylase OafA/YrhL